MTHDDPRVRKTTVTLVDGRELMYFGAVPDRPADYPDRRQLAAVQVQSQTRWDRLLGEWVVIASHRQDRTFQPADDQCPLCPSTAGSRTEIPAPEYEVVVFENRFPTLKTVETGRGGDGDGADGKPAAGPGNLLAGRPAGGRCEVVCSSRIVLRGTHWTAFVPFAAHWPYEVHMYPRRRVPGLVALAGGARAEFCELYLDLLRRFDRSSAARRRTSRPGTRRRSAAAATISPCTWSCSPSCARRAN
jgi:hypothetical protein